MDPTLTPFLINDVFKENMHAAKQVNETENSFQLQSRAWNMIKLFCQSVRLQSI